MNINQYAVYQLKEIAELAAYRSRSYQYLTEHHFQVIVQNYQQAYFTKLFTSDTPEMIRKRLEEHRPKNFRGRPFGVGDVIVINQQGEITAYFVDKIVFVFIARIKTDDIVMGLNFIVSVVFSILVIEHFAFKIKGVGIAVYSIHVKFAAEHHVPVFIKKWFQVSFIMLIFQIADCCTVISVFYCDVF